MTSKNSIEDLIRSGWDISPIDMQVPDYDYGASQEPLNAEFQVRNINAWWWKVKTWYVSITAWTWIQITWVWFTPKVIQVVVHSWNKSAWGYADDVWGTLTQRCIYQDSWSWWNQNSRLFRFSSAEVWLLVSIDSDWFTVNSDLNCTMIYICFW